MPKHSPEQYEILKALRLVQSYMKKQRGFHDEQLRGKPMTGWTQDKHEDYHLQRIGELTQALKVVDWLYMAIDPD